MKFVWSSNAPWGATGYGDQTKLIMERIKPAGHEPAIHALWGLEGGVLTWNNMPVMPKGFSPYGQDIVSNHAQQYGAKYIFTLIDAWIYNNTPFYESLQVNRQRWIPYFPIDCEPIPHAVRLAVERAYRRIVYSKFAASQMEMFGLEYTYIPHCVDTKLMTPKDRKEGREFLRKQGADISDDAFLVGMVAANKGNPSRKAFTQQILAFSEFKKKHSDAVLYLHTSKGVQGEYHGVNLPEYITFTGLQVGRDVFFPNDYNYYMGYPKQYMTDLYSAMDVHLLASTGEGFGIPIVEAQACGVPVIVGGWTAMPELCFSGWVIPKEESEPIWTPVAAYQFSPRVGAIVDALELAYKHRDNPQYKTKARVGALAYDADIVVERYWLPYLEQLEKEDQAAEEEIKQVKATRKRVSVDG